MSDIHSGASAPAESSGVPIEAPASQTQPLGSQTPVAEKPPEPQKTEAKPEAKADDKPSKTAGEAVRKAFEKIDAGKAAKPSDGPAKDAKADAKPDAKVEAKPEAKSEQPRDNGKFASPNPKPEVESKPDAKPAVDAPKRFRPEVQAKWAGVDADVKDDVTRMERELTDGIEKHRRALEPYKPYEEMAKQAGTTVHDALKSYTDLDKLLHTDKARGIEAILERVGISPREYAAFVMNQSPDEQASKSDATIRELRQQNATLEQRLSRIEQGEQDRSVKTTEESVAKFAAENPRFDELAEAIAEEIKHGYSLPDAYERANRLNPAASPRIQIPAASSAPAPDPKEQILKGSKSLNGAPAAGSDPTTRPPAKSSREALQRAFARI